MAECGLSASIEPPDLDIRSFAQIPQKSSSPALRVHSLLIVILLDEVFDVRPQMFKVIVGLAFFSLQGLHETFADRSAPREHDEDK
jgi:hypothetical protein